jgi:hypothetical protein
MQQHEDGTAPISNAPWAILGYRADGRPIFPIAGGAGPLNDSGADDEGLGDDGDDESDDDGDEGEDDSWEPPTKAEFEAMQAKLKKANAEAKRHRLAAKQTGAKAETDVEKAVEAARGEVEAKYKPLVVRTAAKAALAEAGLIGKPDRLLKLLDMDAIDIDDEGDIDGLEDQIKELRADYPDLFQKRTRAGRVNGADRQGSSGERKLSSAERIAQMALRG